MARKPLMLALLFALSGASGLVLEVVWVRQAQLLVGSTTLAVSLVIATFFLGMAAGAELGGRWVDTRARPLRAYGLLELGIGAAGLGVTRLLPLLPGALASWPEPLPHLVVTAAVFPPAALMGATLPCLTRAVADLTPRRAGTGFSLLYALNTLGAAGGCALAGFFLLGSLGISGAASAAALVNVTVGLCALALAKGPLEPVTNPEPSPPAPLAPTRALALLAFLCGFTALSFEVLWFRVLSTYLDSSVYAFSLMLACFLFGLAIGALIFRARLSRAGSPYVQFSQAQSLALLAALFSLLLLGFSRPLATALQRAVGGAPYLSMVLHAALVFLPPSIALGVSFPVLAELGLRSSARAGRAVGTAYAANTAGGVLGSLATGAGLIPVLGTQATYLLVCLLLGLTACLSQAFAGAPRRLWAAPAVALATPLLALLLLPSEFLVSAQMNFADGRRLATREGRDGTLAVIAYDRSSVCASGLYECSAACPDFEHRRLVFGPISYASTTVSSKRYMRALAHLPMLLHPAPRRGLVVCFGTGTTAGAMATYAELEELWLADSNADVFDFARHFEQSNRSVLDDERVRRRVADGRNFLLREKTRFDVISFEPPPPTSAGVANLYTRELYALARARLTERGVLAQWIPLWQQSELHNRRLLRAISDEFAEVGLWLPSRTNAVVLASNAPLRVDPARWSELLGRASIARSLEDSGFEPPSTLAGTQVLNTAGVRAYVAGVAPMVDDDPAVEFFLQEWDQPFSLAGLLAHAMPGLPDPLTRATAEASRLADFHRWEDAARTIEPLRDEPLGVQTRAFLDFEFACLRPSTQRRSLVP